MELLLTMLIWLWQIGWVLVLAGVLCAVLAALIRPLRKRKMLTLAACVAVVCVLLAVLCVRPIMVGETGAEELAQAQQLAADRYSDRLPFTPVCAVVKEGTVQVWYAFAGSAVYGVSGDGYTLVKPLFPWN